MGVRIRVRARARARVRARKALVGVRVSIRSMGLEDGREATPTGGPTDLGRDKVGVSVG